MANLQRVLFAPLNVAGDNYLSWVLDARIHLTAENLGDTIIEGHEVSQQDRARAMILLRHHLSDQLKLEYLTVNDPLELWRSLQERYEHNRLVLLPKARYDWMHIRLQDFKSVNEYNSEMFKIVSKLRLCGETITDADMLEKTFSTFHASNMPLQQQYRERRFTKFSDLIACLLIVEQNNELLMRNHQSRPTGATPIPEVNSAMCKGSNTKRWKGKKFKKYNGKNPQKWKKPHQVKITEKGKRPINQDNTCYRCGKSGHWSRTCRAPKDAVERFKKSVEEKMKELETNYVNVENPASKTESPYVQLNVGDFLDEN